MKDLTNKELREINGGTTPYEAGYAVGKYIRNVVDNAFFECWAMMKFLL